MSKVNSSSSSSSSNNNSSGSSGRAAALSPSSFSTSSSSSSASSVSAATTTATSVDSTPPAIGDLPESIDQASNNTTWGVNRNEDGKIYWYRYDPYERLSSAPLPDHWVTQIYQDALTGLAFPWYIDSETGHKQWFFPSDDEMHANAKQNGKNGKNGGKGGNNQGENQATGADSASSKPASLKLVPSKIKLVRKGSDKGILDGGDEEAGSSKSGSTSAKSARSNSRGKARVKRASSVREDQGKASKTRNNSTPGRKTPGSTRTRTPSVDARGVQRRNSSISGSGTPLSEKTRRTLQSLEAAELQQQLIDSKAAFEKEIKSLKQQMAVERSTARTKLTNLKSKYEAELASVQDAFAEQEAAAAKVADKQKRALQLEISQQEKRSEKRAAKALALGEAQRREQVELLETEYKAEKEIVTLMTADFSAHKERAAAELRAQQDEVHMCQVLLQEQQAEAEQRHEAALSEAERIIMEHQKQQELAFEHKLAAAVVAVKEEHQEATQALSEARAKEEAEAACAAADEKVKAVELQMQEALEKTRRDHATEIAELKQKLKQAEALVEQERRAIKAQPPDSGSTAQEGDVEPVKTTAETVGETDHDVLGDNEVDNSRGVDCKVVSDGDASDSSDEEDMIPLPAATKQRSTATTNASEQTTTSLQAEVNRADLLAIRDLIVSAAQAQADPEEGDTSHALAPTGEAFTDRLAVAQAYATATMAAKHRGPSAEVTQQLDTLANEQQEGFKAQLSIAEQQAISLDDIREQLVALAVAADDRVAKSEIGAQNALAEHEQSTAAIRERLTAISEAIEKLAAAAAANSDTDGGGGAAAGAGETKPTPMEAMAAQINDLYTLTEIVAERQHQARPGNCCTIQ